MFQGLKWVEIFKNNCENVIGNIHISKVRHYETTLKLELQEEI